MIKATEKIWHNGRFIDWDDAKIHVLSHVVSYGSSVFEGIRCYATPAGPAIFRAARTCAPPVDSAKIYRMDMPFTRRRTWRRHASNWSASTSWTPATSGRS